jgi:hypothetical protein
MALLASFATAQFLPEPEGITTIPVKQYPGVTIDYQPTCICDKTVKA